MQAMENQGRQTEKESQDKAAEGGMDSVNLVLQTPLMISMRQNHFYNCDQRDTISPCSDGNNHGQGAVTPKQLCLM